MRAAATVAAVVGAVALAGEPPCRPDGLRTFPAPGSVVPTNVVLILEGVGVLQAPVADLAGHGGVTLDAEGGERVAVKVERGWTSQASRVAVRLRPARALEPGTRYSLSLPGAVAGPLLNDAAGTGLSWQTGPGPDRTAPRYARRPAIAQGRYVAGRVPTRELTVHVGVKDESPAYLEVTMTRMRGSSVVQRYPAPVIGDGAVVGHDGCSGTLGFEDGRAYRMTLALVDSAGNRARGTVTLEVSAPRPARPPGK